MSQSHNISCRCCWRRPGSITSRLMMICRRRLTRVHDRTGAAGSRAPTTSHPTHPMLSARAWPTTRQRARGRRASPESSAWARNRRRSGTLTDVRARALRGPRAGVSGRSERAGARPRIGAQRLWMLPGARVVACRGQLMLSLRAGFTSEASSVSRIYVWVPMIRLPRRSGTWMTREKSWHGIFGSFKC
jgi:hypothetical protein